MSPANERQRESRASGAGRRGPRERARRGSAGAKPPGPRKMKGETSGNRLAVVKLLVDCDDDTILVLAKREGDGNVCHTGERTCFFKELAPRREL